MSNSNSNFENFDVLDLANDILEASEYEHDYESLLDIADAMFDNDGNLVELDINQFNFTDDLKQAVTTTYEKWKNNERETGT